MEVLKREKYLFEKREHKARLREQRDALKIWHRTMKEDYQLAKFRQKVSGYSPQHEIQRIIIAMSSLDKPKYLNLGTNLKPIDSYIMHSKYWKKRDVVVKTAEGTNTKVVFAENDEMMCVIFRKEDKNPHFVVTTYSSFDNYLSALEGNPINKDDVSPRERVMLEQEKNKDEALKTMLASVPNAY